MSLREIFCQDRAIASLQRAFGAGRLAHAYIFAGPEGVGRFKTAEQWAKVLLCCNRQQENSPDGFFYDSCGQCESCRLLESNTHPDFKHIYKELVQFTKKGKGKKTPVLLPKDVIDEFLIEKIAVRPMLSQYVVYVVSEAEKLSVSSQNALLKALEEPPKHCLIILLCSRVENLLATTRSRCQIVRFGMIDEARIVSALCEMGISNKEATYWARFSEGSMGTAIEWTGLEMSEQSCYQIKKELIGRLAEHRLSKSVDFAEWICKSVGQISQMWWSKDKSASKTDITREVQKGLLRMIISAFNDAMRLNVGFKGPFINSDQSQQVEILTGRFDAEEAAAKINKVYENMLWVRQSVNEKLIFEELLLNLADSGTIKSSV